MEARMYFRTEKDSRSGYGGNTAGSIVSIFFPDHQDQLRLDMDAKCSMNDWSRSQYLRRLVREDLRNDPVIKRQVMA
jgi:hypothetical protein